MLVEKVVSDELVKTLQNGGLIAFPTETVFGLGVIFDNKEAYDRLIKVKRRPPEKPFTLMCGKKEDIEKYAIVDERAKKLIEAFMPGQFTIILKAKEGLPSWVVSQEGNVGIRISDDLFVQEMINKVGKPLLVPSANKSGEKPAINHQEVASIFENEVDLIVKGKSVSNTPSTIVLLTDKVIIIREGLISKLDIDKVLEAK